MRSGLRAVGFLAAALLLVSAFIAVVSAIIAVVGGSVTGAHVVTMVAGLAVIGLVVKQVPTAGLLGGYSALVYFLLFAPIVIVVIYAFNAGNVVTILSGFSTRWFATALSDPTITTAVKSSVWIALFSALVSTVLGTSAGLMLGRARGALRIPIEIVVLLSVVVPELVIAIALLLFYVTVNFPLGSAAIMINHSLFGSAVVALIVRSRYVSMGVTLEQASADLGAGPWATLRQITLPQLAPAILAAGMLAFTFSFDDVVGSQFSAGSAAVTWPLRIFSALRFGLKPDINATATMMLGVTLVGFLAAALLWRRSNARIQSARAMGPKAEIPPSAIVQSSAL